MEYSDKNEHLNDDPLENTNKANTAPTGSEIDFSPAAPPKKSKETPGWSEEKPLPGTGEKEGSASELSATEEDTPVSDSVEKEDLSGDIQEPAAKRPRPINDKEKDQEEKSVEESESKQLKEKEAKQEEKIIEKGTGKDATVKGDDEEKIEVEEEEKAEDESENEEGPEKEEIEGSEKDESENKEVSEKEEIEESEKVKTEKEGKEASAKDESETERTGENEKEEEEVKEVSEKDRKEKKRIEKSGREVSEKDRAEKIVKEEKEKEAEEKINYELLSKPDLVKLLDDLLGNKPFAQLRTAVDEIQEVYQKKSEQEYTAKKEKFIAGGGLEQDFKPVEDPVDRQMEELLEKFKTLKSDFNKQLEEEKETNLKTKQELLEEFRILMEGQEGFDATFRKFKQLQKRWFDVGIVPKQNVRDLWNSYNFFVDKFNDYVRINKELRVMDLKKNLDLKLKLCEKTEELATEKNISTAFKTLQKFHSQWREIGPVPREEKDVVWERFKAATSVINKSHQQFQSELKNSLEENLEKKKMLCEKAESIAALDLDKHNEWVQKTNELLTIQKEWKTIGYAPKKENNQIYARFRRACDSFFDRKASFYASTFEHQKDNMDQKLEIVQQAEELKASKDWKSTTDKLIDLQKRWKDIGPVPRKDSDKLWRRFRSACDHFFNAKSEFFGGKNESYEENLKEKQALIEEINKFKPPEKSSELLAALEDFQSRYDQVGFVPVELKDKIRDDFKQAVNDMIDKTGASEEEKLRMRYRIRITAIMNTPRSENKIRFERDKMINKLQQLRNDIGVWENNIGFFKQTERAEDTLAEFNEKIEDAHNRINQLEQKIRIIDELEDSM